MTGLDREYATLAGIALVDGDGHATPEGVAVMTREEVDYLLDAEPEFHAAIIAALADPDDRWHDELILRLTA